MCERCGQDPCQCHLPLDVRPGGKCRCGGTYWWSNYCGAWVCDNEDCGDHRGLARCFCGWPAGEKLEDDVGEYIFDSEEGWKGDY